MWSCEIHEIFLHSAQVSVVLSVVRIDRQSQQWNFQAMDGVVMATNNNFIPSILVDVSNSDAAQPGRQLMMG